MCAARILSVRVCVPESTSSSQSWCEDLVRSPECVRPQAGLQCLWLKIQKVWAWVVWGQVGNLCGGVGVDSNSEKCCGWMFLMRGDGQ